MKKLAWLMLFMSILITGCSSNRNFSSDSEEINVASDKWENKTIYTFGDSITWYDGNKYTENHLESGKIAKGYQSYIRGELGAKVENYGISGETLVGIYNTIKGKKYENTDGVIITGGVNDWFYEVPIGELEPPGSEFDVKTSFGALQSSVEHIQEANKDTAIFLMTPIPGAFKEDSQEKIAGQELPVQYQKMFLEVSDLYNLPVLDLYSESGFNTDYPYWYGDKQGTPLGDRYIHIGDEGYEEIAKHLIPFLVE